jgi:hypothetical protein
MRGVTVMKKLLKGLRVGRSRRPLQSGGETRESRCAHVQSGLEPQSTCDQYGRDQFDRTEDNFYCPHNESQNSAERALLARHEAPPLFVIVRIICLALGGAALRLGKTSRRLESLW